MRVNQCAGAGLPYPRGCRAGSISNFVGLDSALPRRSAFRGREPGDLS